MTCTCEHCGGIFGYNDDDYELALDYGTGTVIYVTCPFCGKTTIVGTLN